MTIHVRGILKTCDLLHRTMQDEAANAGSVAAIAAGCRNGLRQIIVSTVEQVRELCAENQASPADLPTRSRRAWQWLAYLAGEGRLDRHLQALCVLDRLWRQQGGRRRFAVLRLRLEHSAALYRFRRTPRRLCLDLAEGFSLAGDAVLAACVRLAMGGNDPEDERLLRRFGDSSEYRRVWETIESLGGPALHVSAVGRVHDLGRLFDKINAEYFGGRLDRPQLAWKRLRGSHLGRYSPLSDTVSISTVLDRPEVPERVVAFILYHELLHKVLGTFRRNGRTFHHHPEFKKAERRFAGYREVTAFLEGVGSGLVLCADNDAQNKT